MSTPDRLVPDTHAHTHDGQRQVPRDRPDIRAQLTGSFTHVDQRFIRKTTRRDIIHCTRDASRDIKLRCQDHHPAAIAPRPPPSDPQPIRARRRATVAAAPTQPSVIVRYRRPADRRSRPQQWVDAVQTLADLLDRFQEWRNNLPSSLANSVTAEALDAVLELRGYVEELQAAELPKGFGRD